MNELTKIKNLLQYTTTSDKTYNGQDYEGGYHTLNVCGTTIVGQRKPTERIKNVPYDFQNKTVLDIGSNQGGMLFSLASQIKEGVGIDFDHRLVNVANRIKSSQPYNNLNFYVFDLEKEEFNLLTNLSQKKYDIIFLLSVCMWVKNWKELCSWCANNAKSCLFESNGTSSQQDEQIEFLKTIYSNVVLINKKSTDDPSQSKRRLYLCEN